MAKEIERKFLVDLSAIPFSLEDFSSCVIFQGYLEISAEHELRVRRSTKGAQESFTRTEKRGSGLVREENESEISAEQFASDWEKTVGRRVSKTRYTIPLDSELVCELDVYREPLPSLRVVEVEFPTVERSEAFCPPEWFGLEVTGDPRYRNSALIS